MFIVQVTNYDEQDEMPYSSAPCTNYQKFIRLGKQGALQTFFVASFFTVTTLCLKV